MATAFTTGASPPSCADKDADLIFVPFNKVEEEVKPFGAIPCDAKDIELGHHGKSAPSRRFPKKTGSRVISASQVPLGKIINGADTDNSLDRSTGARSDWRGTSPSRVQARPRG
jgi:hypothetical protein